MTTNLTAYLIDVEQRTIRAVEIDPANTLADIRRHIGCGLIDMVRVDPNHSVVVDDNGLTDELPCFTQLEGYDSPLAGNLLIVGNDDAGETISPIRPIEDFAAMLTIRHPMLTPAFETFTGPIVFGSRVNGFTVKLKGTAPAIVPADTGH